MFVTFAQIPGWYWDVVPDCHVFCEFFIIIINRDMTELPALFTGAYWSSLNSKCHNYWDYTPTLVVKDSVVKIPWDFNIFTDHYLIAHRPDIVVLGKQQKTIQIIDIAVLQMAMCLLKKRKKLRNTRVCQLNCLPCGKWSVCQTC